MTKKYRIKRCECICDLQKFYKNAARVVGLEVTDKTLFDCQKICVTKSIQNALWAYYTAKNCTDEEISMLFLSVGPKANLEGDGYEFTIEDGFVSEGET